MFVTVTVRHPAVGTAHTPVSSQTWANIQEKTAPENTLWKSLLHLLAAAYLHMVGSLTLRWLSLNPNWSLWFKQSLLILFFMESKWFYMRCGLMNYLDTLNPAQFHNESWPASSELFTCMHTSFLLSLCQHQLAQSVFKERRLKWI